MRPGKLKSCQRVLSCSKLLLHFFNKCVAWVRDEVEQPVAILVRRTNVCERVRYSARWLKA